MYMCQNLIVKISAEKPGWVYEIRYLLNTLGLNYIWELQRELNIDNCNAYFCVVK